MAPADSTLWGFTKFYEKVFTVLAKFFETVTWPFAAILSVVFYATAAVFGLLGAMIVNTTASFMAAVLSHPKVRASASDVMVDGMNAFAAQPDLSDRLGKVQQNLSDEDISEAARKVGHDLPLLIGGVWSGLFSKNKPQEEGKEQVDDKEKTDNAIEKNGSGQVVGSVEVVSGQGVAVGEYSQGESKKDA